MKTELLAKLASIQTGPFGSQLHKEDYVEKGTPIVTVEHLGKRIFSEQNLPKVSERDRERLFKYVLKEGDIVFSRVGSVDRCSYVDQEHDGWMFSGRCLRVRPTSEIDPLFLYYFFCLESTKDFIRNLAVGATMPSINTTILGEVPITYPNLALQKKIVSILSNVDSKIETNQKINDNLELQAKALFKSWFLDYESFELETQVESEKLPIPKGWRLCQLGEVTKNIRTRVKNRQCKVLSAVNSGSLQLSENYFKKQVFSKDISGYILVEENDFAYNPSRVNIGSIGMNSLGITGCVSPVYVVFRTEPRYQYFFDFFTKSDRFRKEVKARSSGSVRQAMSYADFGLISIAYPPKEVVERFNAFYIPIKRSIEHSIVENQKLSEIREVLLARLLSEELDISNIDL